MLLASVWVLAHASTAAAGALTLLQVDWNAVAEHVGGRSPMQCVLRFLQLPIEEQVYSSGDSAGAGRANGDADGMPFADVANPIMAQVSPGVAGCREVGTSSGAGVERLSLVPVNGNDAGRWGLRCCQPPGPSAAVSAACALRVTSLPLTNLGSAGCIPRQHGGPQGGAGGRFGSAGRAGRGGGGG